MKKYSYFGKRVLSMTIAMAMCASMLQVSAGALDDVGVDITSSESNEQDSITDTGVPVEVEENEPQKNTDGSITNSWTASGTDENGVEIKIDGSETIKETPAETDEDGNIINPGETEEIDNIEVSLKDKGEDHVPNSEPPAVFAPDADTDEMDHEMDHPNHKTEDLDLKDENGKGIEVSADIGNGDKNNTVTDSKSESAADRISDQVEALKPDTSEWGEAKTDSNNKTYWEMPGESENEVIRSTIEEIKDEKGNIIGYRTIRQTITTVKGDYNETGKIEYDRDTPVDPVTVEGGEPGDVPTKVTKPEKPEINSVNEAGELVASVVENEDGSYTVTYEKITGDAVEIPRVDEDGNPVLNEKGEQIIDLVYPTETRTETIKYEESEETYQVKVEEEREDQVIVDTVVDEYKVDVYNDTLKLDLTLLEVTDQSKFKLGLADDATVPKDNDGNPIDPDKFLEDQNRNTNGGLYKYLERTEIDKNFLSNTKVTVTQDHANEYSASATIHLSLNKSQLTKDFVLTVNGTAYRVSAEDKKDNWLEFDEDGNVKDIKLENIKTGDITLHLTGKQEFNPRPEDFESSCNYSSMPFTKEIDLTASIQVTITEIKGENKYDQYKGTDVSTDKQTFIRTDTVTDSKSTLTKNETDAVVSEKHDATSKPVPENPGTDPENPGTDPENPGTDPENPGTDPENPGTDPENPGTDPENPGTDPENPGTDPENPGTDPENPGTDPENPGTDPENPGTDPVVPATPDEPVDGGDTGDTGDTTPTTTLPDADVPLAETPTIDLPDAEVPLADAANALTDDTAALSDDVAVDIADDIVPLAAAPEELAEIAGVEVPLADVPQTGDASPMWFVTLLLSGLALLGLRKKEEI